VIVCLLCVCLYFGLLICVVGNSVVFICMFFVVLLVVLFASVWYCCFVYAVCGVWFNGWGL